MTNAIPKYVFNLITDITPEDLHKMGVKAFGIDLDNTTVYDSGFKLLAGVPAWIKEMKRAGFKMCIITNTNTLRAHIISKRLKLPYFAFCRKPNPDSVLKAAELADVELSEFALIGDRLFADVEAANRAGAISIKVEPFQNEKLLFRMNERRRHKEADFTVKH